MQACVASRCLPAVAAQRSAVQRRARAARLVLTRSFEPEIDGPGVASLLERDRKSADLKAEELLAAFSDEPSAAAAAPKQQQAAAEEEEQQVGQQRQRGPASKRADKLRQEADTPKRAREAIDLGLQKYQMGQYQAALDLFQLSLELPGSGVMRLSGSVREYSCASEGEENAALYNMACCWAAMGQKQSALTVLEALLENNFDQYDAVRTDPDLASVRGPELEKLLDKYDGLAAKLFGGKKKQQTSNKPWLQW